MDYFEKAGAAIEAVVKQMFPRHSPHLWSTIVPMDDVKGWGLGLAAWATMARQIEQEFNKRIHPLVVAVPKPAIVTAGGRELIDFQDYLAAKATESEAAVGRRFNIRAAVAQRAAAQATQASKKGAQKKKEG